MPWQLDHVQVAIPPGCEDRCDAFYVDLLNFATLEKPPTLAQRGGRWYRRGDATLHLGVDAQFRPAKKAHPAFAVDDYDVVLRQLTSAGYETVPDDAVPGVRRCYVEDPVGNRLELIDAATPR